jgi:hypothetical protein
MIGGKMVGIILALMIANIKRVSQLFQRFRSADMLEILKVPKLPHFADNFLDQILF